MTPIFIISMPRSGSTLLQKMLCTSEHIESTGEPSLLLPIAYLRSSKGVLSEYQHRENLGGFNALVAANPKGEQAYLAAVRCFCDSIYQGACAQSTTTYFLDKTPKYWMIWRFIFDLYPDAKYIFLFRDPLEIISSSIRTWSNDKLVPHSYLAELEQSPTEVTAAWNARPENSIKITYNDLVDAPSATISKICSHLDLPYRENMLTNWKQVDLLGDFGDPTGINKFDSIQSNSEKDWSRYSTSLYRRRFLLRYLKRVPNEYFELAKTSRDESIRKCRIMSSNGIGISDAITHAASLAYSRLNLKLFRSRYSDVTLREFG